MSKDKDWNDLLREKGLAQAKKEFEEAGERELNNIISLEKEIDERDSSAKIIRELNEKHIFINTIGGKSFVAAKVYSEVTEKKELEFLQLDTFKNIYLNRTYFDGKTHMTIGSLWLQSTRRTTVESVIFDPSSPSGIITRDEGRYLNLWEGFGVVPKKGTWKHTKRHVYKILCNSEYVKFKYVIRWLAWMVQNPDKMAETALIFKGEMGAGKGFLFTQFKKIFGPHGMAISNPSRLTGRFNSHFRKLCFLFCDEVYYPGNKEIEGAIKAMITEEYIDSESKHKDPIAIKNRLHIAMATNNEWVIPAGPNERRYFVETVSSMYAKNRATEAKRKVYFTRLWGEMDNGGREAMLFDLLNYNLKEWHPRNDIPETKELRKQKELSLDPLNSAMLTMLEDGTFPGVYTNGSYYVSAEALYEHLEKIEPKVAKFSSNRKAECIKKLGAKKGRIPGVGRVRWEFPELPEVRRLWNKTSLPMSWDDLPKWTIHNEF